MKKKSISLLLGLLTLVCSLSGFSMIKLEQLLM